MLSDSKKQVFKINILIKSGVVKEVRQILKLNDKTCTLKWFERFDYNLIILLNI